MTEKKTEVLAEGKGTIAAGDDSAIPVTARLLRTSVAFQIRSRVEVNFAELRQSGELEEVSLDILERGYAGAAILFLDASPAAGFGGKRIHIGILTGECVYPKNTFFITESTAVKCLTPTGEPPREVKPH